MGRKTKRANEKMDVDQSTDNFVVVDSSEHPYGMPVHLLDIRENQKFEVCLESLEELLSHEDVKHRKIVAIAMIGSLRKGKSFFLNYCLRYLYGHYPSVNYPDNSLSNSEKWYGEDDEPLKGFSWRSGCDRDTTGILIWNDVFLHTDERSGEKLAILILDTQGLFDKETSVANNSNIFAISSLISSIQVLNLTGVIQEDQLQYLQFATEFAKFAIADNKQATGKPFQNLTFLIRNWENPDDHAFGIKGGNEYLKKILDISNIQTEELKSVRKFIECSYEEISGALLPEPGKKVAKQNIYDGNLGQMDNDFREELLKVIEYLLKPEKLVRKKVNGSELIAAEYVLYVKEYFELFQSNKLPQAQTIYEHTIEKHMRILINSCLDKYKKLFINNEDLSDDNVEKLKSIHVVSKNQALLMFTESKKMGNDSHEEKFEKILDDEIEKIWLEWSNLNEKNSEKIREEKEKVRQAEEEKQKLELEQTKTKMEAAKKLKEIEAKMAEKDINHKQLVNKMELKAEEYKKEQERLAQEKLNDLEQLRAEKRIDYEKYLTEREKINEQQKNAMESMKVKHEEEIKRIELENKNNIEELKKIKEAFEERFKAEEMRYKKIEAEKAKEEAIRKQLEIELSTQKYKEKCLIEERKPVWHSISRFTDFPERAISSGPNIYVGRAVHKSQEVPGSIFVNLTKFSIAYDGTEIKKNRFEVLTGGHEWKRIMNNELPSRCIFGGNTANGKQMYIGRTKHDGHMITGKVIDKKLYFGYNGKEITKDDFECLTYL